MKKQEILETLRMHRDFYRDADEEWQLAKARAYEKGMELVSLLDEPAKPVIPEFVAEYLEDLREGGLNFYSAYKSADSLYKAEGKVKTWLLSEENLEDFARAWLNGYEVEVEKEKRYYVLDKEDIPLLAKSNNRIYKTDTLLHINEDGRDKAKFELTEQEIKDIDERYWIFAVPVEEVTP